MKQVKVSIATNPVFEMLVSLNRIADSDQMESSYFENAGYTPHPRMTEIIQEIKTGLSMFYRQEITFFFSKPVCSLLWELVISEGIRDIDQLAVKFLALSDNDSLKYLLSDVIEVFCQLEEDMSQNEHAVEAMLADRLAFEQRIIDCSSLSSRSEERRVGEQ